MNSSTNNNDVPVMKNVACTERIQRLNESYQQEFNSEPSFYVRVPGRVNIIGEHIDYCGYPVLPTALEQDILLAVGLTKKLKLCLRNINPKYQHYDIPLGTFEEIVISPDPKGKPYWYNYVLCGIKGALEYLNNRLINGLEIYIDGNIPEASGLSSSSALVSAACLAFLHAQNTSINKTQIASLCATSERYIGTQGGGMDQAIAFLAEKNCAQYITWQPLQATSVVLPKDAVFVVAHSLAEANKAATNDFNRRVIECRLAAKILVSEDGAVKENKIITLSEAQKMLSKTLEEMIALVEMKLPKEYYTKDEICNILNISKDEMEEIYLTDNTKHLTEFKLQQRALHVYNEAVRVEKFRKICTRQPTNGKQINGSNGSMKNGKDTEDNILGILGTLMSESHSSLNNLYECSHENLDRLVEISRTFGVHTRLTGAGWGGCVVTLCPKEKVDDYIDFVKEEFYRKHCNIDKVKSNNYIFATTPNHGAVIYENIKINL